MPYRTRAQSKSSLFSVFSKAGMGRRVVLLTAALLIGAGAHAGTSNVLQVVHARREHFKRLGRTAKSLRDQIGRSRPNWNLVVSDTNEIERLAQDLPNWFPAGSGQARGIKTKARAIIWSKPQEFARAAHRLSNSAAILAQAASRHDLAGVRLRARAVGQACGSCHHRFRSHSNWW